MKDLVSTVETHKVIGLMDDGISVIVEVSNDTEVIRVTDSEYKRLEKAIGAENVKFLDF